MSYTGTTQQFLSPSTIRKIKKNQSNQLIDDFCGPPVNKIK